MELEFVITREPDGEYLAVARRFDIFTKAVNIQQLINNIYEALHRRFRNKFRDIVIHIKLEK